MKYPMKRITETTNPQTSPKISTPTIDNLLNAMPKSGMETFEDRVLTFAVLGFYFDGMDYSNRSVTAVTRLIKRMDVVVPDQPDLEELEDEDNDRYGFAYEGVEYWFTSPSVRNMPKMIKDNVPGYYRELISKLSDKPDQVLTLPYYIFGKLGDTLGKSLGIV
jgi:hypothetical protein